MPCFHTRNAAVSIIQPHGLRSIHWLLLLIEPIALCLCCVRERGVANVCLCCVLPLLFRTQAGAGLVADSVPENEYEETLNKAAALGRAIDLAEQAFVDEQC